MDALFIMELALILFGSTILTISCVLTVLTMSRRRHLGRKDASTEPEQAETVFRLSRGHLVAAPDAWTRALKARSGTDDWERLAGLFSKRFPDLPETAPDPDTLSVTTFEPLDPEDSATLRVDGTPEKLVLTLREDVSAGSYARHAMTESEQAARSRLTHLDAMPFPAWSTTPSGRVTWRNAEYAQLEAQCRVWGGPAPLLPGPDTPRPDPARSRARVYRAALDPDGDHSDRVFDVIATQSESGWQYAAQDVTSQVNMEGAQRSFVQTLTKTFAQLDTGLAIFDRDKHLALFNPALIDLTTLDAAFLAGRPDFHEVFDQLRDRQIMPEPKNYSSWRAHLGTLFTAASNGTYEEKWTLPTGSTYRVIGRPHPNGAVAFLISDVTAEVTMTRQFRQQMVLNQSVLDAMDDAIAVFSTGGTLGYCNEAFMRLWNVPCADETRSVTLHMLKRLWDETCRTPEVMQELVARMQESGTRTDWSGTAIGIDGHEIRLRMIPLSGGASMVTFSVASLEDMLHGGVLDAPTAQRAVG